MSKIPSNWCNSDENLRNSMVNSAKRAAIRNDYETKLRWRRKKANASGSGLTAKPKPKAADWKQSLKNWKEIATVSQRSWKNSRVRLLDSSKAKPHRGGCRRRKRSIVTPFFKARTIWMPGNRPKTRVRFGA